MAATRIASRSTTIMSSIFRTTTSKSLISPKARISVPNPNSTSSRFNTSSLRQSLFEGSLPRLLRRELSTHQPFHSVVACACLVSKLPSDVTSFEDAFIEKDLKPDITTHRFLLRHEGGFVRIGLFQKVANNKQC